MRVAVQAALGITVVLVVAGQVPDDERLVTAARKEHVGASSLSASVQSLPAYVVLTSPER